MDELRSLILNKAQSRFDRFGFQKTTMDEISRDCGISKKTLYAQFEDKQNLFDCLFVRESHQALADIFTSMGKVDDPLNRLIQLLRTSIAHFSEDNFLTRLLKNDDSLFSALLNGKYHSLVTKDLISIIAGMVAEGKARGRIRHDIDEQVAAYIGLRLFEAFSYMRTIPFEVDKERQGFYTDALVDFFANALAVRQ